MLLTENKRKTLFGLQLSVIWHVTKDLNYQQTFLSARKCLFLVLFIPISFFFPSSSPVHPLLSQHKLLSYCHHCDLRSARLTQSPTLLWRTELEICHTSHCESKQRHESRDHVIWVWFTISCWAAKTKKNYLEIQGWHMVSLFPGMYWFATYS